MSNIKTVKDLISELQKLDPKAKINVPIDDGCSGLYPESIVVVKYYLDSDCRAWRLKKDTGMQFPQEVYMIK